MAIFQYNNQSMNYQTASGPFAFDLVLLQGSKFSADYWQLVRDNLAQESPDEGRILVCEEPIPSGTFLTRFFETLGLQSVHVVAVGDAAELVGEVERQQPGLIAKSLMYPQGAPKGEALAEAIRNFVGLKVF